MKDGEDIETMFSRFQILVSGLQVLDKSYIVADHVRKVLISLPPKWRPKVTTDNSYFVSIIRPLTLDLLPANTVCIQCLGLF
jgi:hypothetical protein